MEKRPFGLFIATGPSPHSRFQNFNTEKRDLTLRARPEQQSETEKPGSPEIHFHAWLIVAIRCFQGSSRNNKSGPYPSRCDRLYSMIHF